MNHRDNGPLPPRRRRQKRKRFPVYYGFIALVLLLFSGVLYAQAAEVFGEKEGTGATGASENLTAFSGPANSDEGFDNDEDGDIELKQEKPDDNSEKSLKNEEKDAPGKKAESNKPERGKSGEGKSDLRSPGNKEAKPPTAEKKPVVAVDNKRTQSPSTASEADSPSDSLTDFEREVVELVNQERIKRGLAPLKADVGLSKVARVKSEDMRDNGYFSHESPTYGSPFDMMRKFGIQYRTAGENIAAGYSTPEAAVNGWMNSSGHRANILSSRFTHIGVGYAKGGPYRHYWTQQFISK